MWENTAPGTESPLIFCDKIVYYTIDCHSTHMADIVTS